MHEPSRTRMPKLMPRRRLRLLASVAAGIGITATACGSGATSTSAYDGTNRAPSGKAAAISTHTTPLGNVLAGPDGRSLYLFEKDHGTTSACSGACASLWPPVTSASLPLVSGMARPALVGTTHRGDGTAGDVTGEGLTDFGASWYVVSATGHKIDND
jgi:predicted lipoprotein with Yx(FWY)xxD motif